MAKTARKIQKINPQIKNPLNQAYMGGNQKTSGNLPLYTPLTEGNLQGGIFSRRFALPENGASVVSIVKTLFPGSFKIYFFEEIKMKTYEAQTLFEVSLNANGSNFLLIYGKHVNGYYCCIPNWKIGCEMAEPKDTFYNYEKLREAGLGKVDAETVAQAIKQAANGEVAAEKPNADAIQTLIKELFSSIHEERGKLEIISKSKLMIAYFIAEQLYLFDTANLKAIEKKVIELSGGEE